MARGLILLILAIDIAILFARKMSRDASGVTDDEVAELAAFTQRAMRTLRSVSGAQGFNIGSFKDVTPIPHNGCRPRKRRRV